MGAGLKNTADTGFARLQLDANGQACTAGSSKALEDALLPRPTKRSICRIAPQEQRRSWWKQTDADLGEPLAILTLRPCFARIVYEANRNC